MSRLPPAIFAVLLMAGCYLGSEPAKGPSSSEAGPWIARLSSRELQDKTLAPLRREFARRNPGYDLSYQRALRVIDAFSCHEVAFIQSGKASANIGKVASEISVGDVILLRKGQTLRLSAEVGALIFEVPKAPSEELPSFLRPDWDPRITDTPGGCATETGAYRRIVLTWEKQAGSYVYHALNAHRVRMMDSMTHYHPVNGGFDEFYLVQMAGPEAKVLTSRFVDKITHPESVERKDLDGLIESHPLRVDDFVYIPRGTAHRGVGGVLAQVITVPGFKPGAQFCIDPQLLALSRRFGLEGANMLPFNREAASRP